MQLEGFECPASKCFLDLVYPNSEAPLACDSDCYFSKEGQGEKYLQKYIKHHEEEWLRLNSI